MAKKLTKTTTAVGALEGLATVMKSDRKRGPQIDSVDPHPKSNAKSFSKSLLNALNGPKGSIERLAFTEDPSSKNEYQSLYRPKLRLIPDTLLKRVAIQDDLVASILNARSNHLSAFGRPQEDRFKLGFKVEPNRGVIDNCSAEQKKVLHQRIEEATRKLTTCGHTTGWKDEYRVPLSRYFAEQARNALVFGRFATEIVYFTDVKDGNKRKFHSFRALDAGTIFKAAPQKDAQEKLRHEAHRLLEQLKNKKLDPERFKNDEYAWVQVIDGRPEQALSAEECVVHNCYPITDVELAGYPLTPLDTAISAVTTHINIGTHNKLFFQSGRATRGMLVIKSEDVDDNITARVKQAFQASINSVNNSWRMPVFGIGKDDEVQWQPFDMQGGRDQEFQYLSDMNARVILSAFQMSPEELPGYAHLSRGTNNQALSESNNSYQLTAHRDVGLRPLLYHFQDFLNYCILPMLDEELSRIATIQLVGLDAETPEKEAVNIQTMMPLHGTMDEVLNKVEKKALGREWGGEFPLNPQYQTILDKYFTVGSVKSHFFGDANAQKDPTLQYYRDPFWFQNQQMIMQQQQMQQQAAMQQQQAAQGGGTPPNGDGDGGGGGEGGRKDDSGSEGSSDEGSSNNDGVQRKDSPTPSPDAGQGGGDLTSGIDQAMQELGKSERAIPVSRQRILARQRAAVRASMDLWEASSREMLETVVAETRKVAPRK